MSSRIEGIRNAREVDDVDPPPAMFAATLSIGTPWIACQIRLGAPISSAIPAATQGRGPASARRGPSSRIAIRQQNKTRAIITLISIATPAATPTAIHGPHRPSSSRSARISSQRVTAVASRSKVVVSNRCPVASGAEVRATAIAAATCPRRPRPYVLAVRAATTTYAPMASAGRIRKAQR